jgi:hypothetical protein
MEQPQRSAVNQRTALEIESEKFIRAGYIFAVE